MVGLFLFFFKRSLAFILKDKEKWLSRLLLARTSAQMTQYVSGQPLVPTGEQLDRH